MPLIQNIATTLINPPCHDGSLPEGGIFAAQSKTGRVLSAARAFMIRISHKAAVDNIKNYITFYPYAAGAARRRTRAHPTSDFGALDQ